MILMDKVFKRMLCDNPDKTDDENKVIQNKY
jgi:hypothetical protein